MSGLFGNSGGGDIIARISKYYDMLNGRLGQLRQGGAFDENARIAQIDKDYREAGKIGGENLAGGMSVAGYKKGDSEIGVRSVALQNRLLESRERSILEARQQALQSEMGFLGLANPSGMSSLMPYTQKPGLGGILKSVMPFIPGMQGAAAAMSAGGNGGSDATSEAGGGQSQVRVSATPGSEAAQPGPTPAVAPTTPSTPLVPAFAQQSRPKKKGPFDIAGF